MATPVIAYPECPSSVGSLGIDDLSDVALCSDMWLVEPTPIGESLRDFENCLI